MMPRSSVPHSGTPRGRRSVALWLLFALPLPALANPDRAPADSGGDPFIGTWSLNAAASKYAAGDMPQDMVIVMQAVPGGIHYKSETIRRDRQVATAEYTAEYDGHLAMVVGDAGILAPVALKRIDRNTVEASYMHGLQKVASSRRVVSPDGGVMTVTTSSKREDGSEVVNVGVYRKLSTPKD